MKLEEALFYWLQIKVVAMARPHDGAAEQTLQFFEQILQEDYSISHFSVNDSGDNMYLVQYELDGTVYHTQFRQELAGQLLADINANPKYNEA